VELLVGVLPLAAATLVGAWRLWRRRIEGRSARRAIATAVLAPAGTWRWPGTATRSARTG